MSRVVGDVVVAVVVVVVIVRLFTIINNNNPRGIAVGHCFCWLIPL